jgi:hypothetical protein
MVVWIGMFVSWLFDVFVRLFFVVLSLSAVIYGNPV